MVDSEHQDRVDVFSPVAEKLSAKKHKKLHWNTIGGFFVCLLVGPFLAWGLFALYLGSNDAAVAFLHGARYRITPADVTLEHVARGRDYEFRISVTNYQSKQLGILGVETSCGCISSTELPTTVSELGSKDVVFHFSVPVDFPLSEFAHEIRLYIGGSGWANPVLVHGNIEATQTETMTSKS